MSPADFVGEMLRLIRSVFFAKATEKQWYQEKPLLEQAITWPARWLNERGARLPASKYRAILMTVINTIRQHGNRDRIKRFSVYFLYCVQEHMKHHGEDYYEQAKAAQPIGSLLPGAMRKLARANGADRTTDVLAETHRVLSRRGIRKAKTAADSGDLFSHCKAPATRPQNGEKVPQTFANSPDSGHSSSNLPSEAGAIRK